VSDAASGSDDEQTEDGLYQDPSDLLGYLDYFDEVGSRAAVKHFMVAQPQWDDGRPRAADRIREMS
jgi:hypothetical protein